MKKNHLSRKTNNMFHSPSSSGYYSDQQRYHFYPGAGPWMTPRHGHGGFHGLQGPGIQGPGLQGPGLNEYHQPYLVVRGQRSRKNVGGSGSRPLPTRSRHHQPVVMGGIGSGIGSGSGGIGGGNMMSDFYPARLQHQHQKR